MPTTIKMDRQPALAIYDPEEKPFGPLSNNYRRKLRMDGIIYESVTNYAFSSLPKSVEFKQMIRKFTNYNKIGEFAMKLVNEEILKINVDSLQASYSVRFMNPVFRDLLIATGDRRLEYRGDSEYGMGSDGKGKNIIGRILMGIRTFVTKKRIELEKIQREQENNEFIYYSYMAYKALAKLMIDGRDDLQSFIGLGEGTDVNKLKPVFQRLDPNQVNMRENSIDTVMELYKKGLLPEHIERRGADIARLVRRDFIQRYKYEILEKHKDAVFNAYIESVYTPDQQKDLDEEFRRSKIILNKAYTDESNILDFIKDKVYTMYKAGLLTDVIGDVTSSLPKLPGDDEVSDAIQYVPVRTSMIDIIENNDKKTIVVEDDISSVSSESEEEGDPKKFNIVGPGKNRQKRKKKATEDEGEELFAIIMDDRDEDHVEAFPDDVYDILDTVVEKKNEKVLPIVFGGREYDADTWFLNPLTENLPDKDVAWIVIDNIPYPSPFHYVCANMFAYISESPNKLENHMYLLKDTNGDIYAGNNYESYDVLNGKFSMYLKYYMMNKLGSACVNAMNIKFSNSELQSLLVATGDMTIEYADYEDDYLGIGKGMGTNMVGKYLMEKRASFMTQGIKPSNIEPVKVMSLSDIVSNDKDLLNWFNMRVSDICTTVNLFSEYLYDRIQYRSRLVKDNIIQFILANIYDSCGYSGHVNKQNIMIPSTFSRMVHAMLDPMEVDAKGMKSMFDYMIYLTGNLLGEFAQSQSESFGREIGMIQAGLIGLASQVKGTVPPSVDPISIRFFHAVANILTKAKVFVTKNRVGKFTVSEKDLDFAFKVVTPGGFIPPMVGNREKVVTIKDGIYNVFMMGGKKYAITTIDSENVLKGVVNDGVISYMDSKEEYEVISKYNILPSYRPYIKSIFEKYGLPITDMQCVKVSEYFINLMYGMASIQDMRKKSRIAFFSANMKPVDIVIRDADLKDEMENEMDQIRYAGIGEALVTEEGEDLLGAMKPQKGDMGDEEEDEMMEVYDNEDEDDENKHNY